MLLSGQLIKKLIDENKIVIEPDPTIKEASVKIHLSGLFGKKRNFLEEQNKFILQPKEFILAKTFEKIILPEDYAGFYDTCVDLASQGIITHMGSMLIDPGFSGNIQLEIFNASDSKIVLEKGMRVGHLMITEIKNL